VLRLVGDGSEVIDRVHPGERIEQHRLAMLEHTDRRAAPDGTDLDPTALEMAAQVATDESTGADDQRVRHRRGRATGGRAARCMEMERGRVVLAAVTDGYGNA
jgi:hypothetical protein